MVTLSTLLLAIGLVLFVAGVVFALLQKADRSLASGWAGLFCWLAAELLRSGIAR